MVLFVLSLGSLFLVSLLLGVHLFGQVSLNPALRAQSAGTYIPVKHALDISAPRLAKPLMQVGLLAVSATVVAAAISGQALATIASVVSLAALIATLVAILRGDLPINRRMSAWTVADVPSDWEKVRAQWERYFAFRVGTNAAALAGTVVTAVASVYLRS
ncbi:hypothetical protein [Naasia lichenicola]|uniref:DUF1772 domain-containing protein n=1 Tax=Naasia lichenicola TaxID=2565933 RepID=A0A4S4FL11_9MICO|nr:hypothetical protein [Naasia lichenicola]THG29876.1 hypothetical protein E6C64_14595 [Naasia lichenicola]